MGDQCWICLEPTDQVSTPCQCPRPVHPRCLALWQAWRTGTPEETHCRFCHAQLPNWKPILAPPDAIQTQNPIFTISANGMTKRISIPLGDQALAHFKRSLLEQFDLPEDQHIDISFHCLLPGTEQHLTLNGWDSADAAIILAASRVRNRADEQGALLPREAPAQGWWKRWLGRAPEPQAVPPNPESSHEAPGTP